MHISIDDSYSQVKYSKPSKLITPNRRTHVAVIFKDEDVYDIRQGIKDCLYEVSSHLGEKIDEFHFTDIYNRQESWENVENEFNLTIFEFFAEIYNHYLWPIEIQTIDNYSLTEHGIDIKNGKIDGIDLSTKEGQSLLLLLLKIKHKYIGSSSPLTIYMDEGIKKPNSLFAQNIFHDWPATYQGLYKSSADEPLLQIADFFAFSINRCTHLSLKENRSEIDNWFLETIGQMNIQCDNIKKYNLQENFTIDDFDKKYEEYRSTLNIGNLSYLAKN